MPEVLVERLWGSSDFGRLVYSTLPEMLAHASILTATDQEEDRLH
jgi:hypothetical protein